jgi:HAE1 family hydrophobic/amphiphilic exporter-1
MFVLALIVLGYQAKNRMPQEYNPKMDAPVITVVTDYSGAGPNEIETLVTEPIEKAVSSIGKLDTLTSTSQDGVSTISLEFDNDVNVESAAADVRDKVSSVRQSLPDSASEPQVLKLDTSSMPVMEISMAGPISPKEMRYLADNLITDHLAKVGGVASINVMGGEEREIAVAVDKARLDAYGLGIDTVVNALRGASHNVPAGSIQEGERNYSIRTVGEFQNVQEIANVPIPLPGNGGSIFVHDVATIKDTVAEPTTHTRLNGQPSVVLSIQKNTDANTVSVAEGIKRELADLQAELPAGVHPVIAMDQSTTVSNAIRDVNTSLIEGIILVVLIIFLFLHTARATFIVGLAIPTSLLATYIPISALGFTQNTMVLLALSLVVGILVDDSIVVLENIERHLRQRKHPEDAALQGRAEIGLAAITITMVDVVVFLPIAFMGGMMGAFFRQFGITVAVATAFSLLISFTLTPMLAAKILKSEDEKAAGEHELQERRQLGQLTLWDRVNLMAGRLFRTLEAFLRTLDSRYRDVLDWALHNRFLTLVIGNVTLLVVFAMAIPLQGGKPSAPRIVIAFLALLLTVIAMRVNRQSKWLAATFGVTVIAITLTIYLPFGFTFFPTSDQGQLAISIRTAPESSLEATDKVVHQVEAIVNQLPEMQPVYRLERGKKVVADSGFCLAVTGSGSTNAMGGDSGYQYANISVEVVGKQYRTRSIQQIMDWLTQQTAHIPGTESISISLSSSTGTPSATITKDIQGQNMDAILEQANRVADVMRKVPGAMNVDVSYKASLPERRIVVDRLRAAQYGLTVEQVANAARTAITGDDTVKFRDSGTEFPIRVQYAKDERNQAASVETLIIGTKDGAPIYLRDVAKIVYEHAPTKINRQNRQRVVSVTADIAAGYQMGNVNQSIDQALASVPRVTGTTIASGGMTQKMAESMLSVLGALLLVVVLVYMLMGALFESFFTPFVIMFSLPQAMVGGLLALLITGTSLGMTAAIGIIMLMGLVTKNAILLVDYTNTLRSRGMGVHDALLEAGPTRLRPILMTTLAMIGGMLPTALALSEGSESRQPLAIAVIGGLILSTLLTLIVIPVSYTIVDEWWNGLVRKYFPKAYQRYQAKQGARPSGTVSEAPVEAPVG